MMEPEIKESLRELVGQENFTDSLIDLIAYSKDASEFKQRPEAAMFPMHTEQISAI
ncbi:MAG: glycolate oxidase subunit GlcD, partial [Deltaproteobacteria bacterium]|nr:glycolate oxidase subunit GlcD [Deltaproteobacteria bacterium]